MSRALQGEPTIPPLSPEDTIAQAVHAALPEIEAPKAALPHPGPVVAEVDPVLDVSATALRAGSDEFAPPSPRVTAETVSPELHSAATVSPSVDVPDEPAKAVDQGSGTDVTPDAGTQAAPIPPATAPGLFELQRSLLDLYRDSAVAGLSFWASLLQPRVAGPKQQDDDLTRTEKLGRRAA